MSSLIHADIFFFVSTIALIFVAIILLIILVYILTILNDVKEITRKVKKESNEVIDDLHSLRTHIKEEGLSLKYLSTFFRHILRRGKKVNR